MGSKPSVSTIDQDLLLFSSKPVHIRGLKYSKRHHVYTNDLSKLSNMPEPKKWKAQKSDILKPEDLRKADNAAKSIGKTLNTKPLKYQVEELTKELNSDLAKARSIYRWLTIQPDRTNESSCFELDTDTVQYPLYSVGNKLTYAQLFSLMCGMVGVPCVVISGFAKGSTYQAGEMLTRRHRQEWNAVLISEIWWLVDPFWGACEFVGKWRAKIEYSFDEFYFLTNPEQLILTHFPDVSEWQLLDKPISLREFQKQACLRQRFFELDMKSVAYPVCRLKRKDGDISFIFGLNPHRSKQQTFRCYVKEIELDKKRNSNDAETKPETNDNTTQTGNPLLATNVDVTTVKTHDGKYLNIRIKFQEVGIYSVQIVGKENTDNEYDWIAVYRVHIKKINQHNYLKGDKPSDAIEAHKKRKQEKDIIKVNLEREKARQEEEMKKTEQMADEMDQLKHIIFNAMKTKKLNQLESAVGEAMEKGYTEGLGIEIMEALKRFKKLMQGVLGLNQQTIAEIRSYSNPPEEVYKVMTATLLLLGNYEEETKDWQNIKVLIGKTGKMSLKRRVTEFNIESLQPEIALKSKQILDDVKFETICVTSPGAAAFFTWTTGIISEMDTKYANNFASTSRKINKL